MMEGDLTNKINEIRALTEENNKILKSIRRHGRLATFMRLVYWIVIIGIGIGSYYYIQPFVDPLISSYKNIQEAQGRFGNIPKSLENLNHFFSSPTATTTAK